MTKTESKIKTKELLLIGVLALVAMTLVAIAVIPSLRLKVKEALLGSGRDVVAKVSGTLTAQGPVVTVLKIRSKNSLGLEVYAQDENEGLVLLAKLPLFEARDGYFMLQGNATNLALTDVDKDGNPEVVAPTYDEQMVPRLNIFKFNPEAKTFDRMTAPADYRP